MKMARCHVSGMRTQCETGAKVAWANMVPENTAATSSAEGDPPQKSACAKRLQRHPRAIVRRFGCDIFEPPEVRNL